jgi:RNA 2',3'-cyclic 3'-phosphodiesterase
VARLAERWFFALWPTAPAARALATAALPLIHPGARPAHPLDLHLTLHFLGPLSPEQLDAARAAADSITSPPFPLRLDRAGSFPGARVLWCAPSAVPGPLADLAARLEQALAVRGLATEPRPFRPHLTLARRFRGPLRLPWTETTDWAVSEFVLAHGRDGRVPRYRRVGRWPLAAPA